MTEKIYRSAEQTFLFFFEGMEVGRSIPLLTLCHKEFILFGPYPGGELNNHVISASLAEDLRFVV